MICNIKINVPHMKKPRATVESLREALIDLGDFNIVHFLARVNPQNQSILHVFPDERWHLDHKHQSIGARPLMQTQSNAEGWPSGECYLSQVAAMSCANSFVTHGPTASTDHSKVLGL
jgi:hypothetical protein